MMKKKGTIYVLSCLFVGLFMSCSLFTSKKPKHVLADMSATLETRELYKRLFDLVGEGTMIGHQDDLAYGHHWYREPGRSDVKEVTGDYPAVIGWELGDIELDSVFNLDSVYFDDIRAYVRETAKRGGLTTMSWHANNIATGGNAWDCGQDTVVRSILPGGIHHTDYLVWLDRLGDFFNSLKDDDGTYIPIVFRPYHEHTGGWFWWGADQCTPEEYKALWRMTQNYLQDVKHVHHLIYSYSTAEIRDRDHFLERYPGDDVIDVLGFDCYVQGDGSLEDLEYYRETMMNNIAIVSGYGEEAAKIVTIGETGYEGVKHPRYFTEIMYPLIREASISWVLFWRNAYEQDKREHYYLPFVGHPAAEDFKDFSSRNDVLMSRDIAR